MFHKLTVLCVLFFSIPALAQPVRPSKDVTEERVKFLGVILGYGKFCGFEVNETLLKKHIKASNAEGGNFIREDSLQPILNSTIKKEAKKLTRQYLYLPDVYRLSNCRRHIAFLRDAKLIDQGDDTLNLSTTGRSSQSGLSTDTDMTCNILEIDGKNLYVCATLEVGNTTVIASSLSHDTETELKGRLEQNCNFEETKKIEPCVFSIRYMVKQSKKKMPIILPRSTYAYGRLLITDAITLLPNPPLK